MKKKTAVQLVLHLLLFGGLAIVVLPMIYMVSTSLKPNGALYEYPPRFLPSVEEITLENYQYIIGQGKFYINFLNSVYVSVLSVLLAAVAASALGYVIARFEFPGKKLLFSFIVLILSQSTVLYKVLDVYSFLLDLQSVNGDKLREIVLFN